MRLVEFLCSIINVCGLSTAIGYLTSFDTSVFLSPPNACHFLCALNKSLKCNSSIEQEFLPPLDPCDCKYLSHALRRDPAISSYNLVMNRSKSLIDLTTAMWPWGEDSDQELESLEWLKEESDQSPVPEPSRTFTDHHHSCPDLLEIQSLRDVHDKIRQDNRLCPWLNLNLNNTLSSSYSSTPSHSMIAHPFRMHM